LLSQLVGTVPGDVTLDQTVDRRDVAALARGYGSLAGRWSLGDVTGDGASGLADLALVQMQQGATYAQPNGGPMQAAATSSCLCETESARAGDTTRMRAPVSRVGSPRVPLRAVAVDGVWGAYNAFAFDRPAVRRIATASLSHTLRKFALWRTVHGPDIGLAST
jgi:hypothetical protein